MAPEDVSAPPSAIDAVDITSPPEIAAFAAAFPCVMSLRFEIPAAERAKPYDHGWLVPSTERMLSRWVFAGDEIILELGAWLGRSTIWLAKHAPNAMVFSVDHWNVAKIRPWLLRRHPQLAFLCDVGLYETFLANVEAAEVADRVVPMRMETIAAIDRFSTMRVAPDVVYLDASHDYTQTLAEVSLLRSLWPSTRLVGDDWEWNKPAGESYGPVGRAVTAYLSQSRRRDPAVKLEVDGNGWCLCPRP